MAKGKKDTLLKLKNSFKTFDVQDLKAFLEFLSEVDVIGVNSTKAKQTLTKFQKQVGDFREKFDEIVFEDLVKLMGKENAKRMLEEMEKKENTTDTDKAATTTDNTTTPKEKK